ncbi:Phytochrome-like protein cph2 [compost metagenome]
MAVILPDTGSAGAAIVAQLMLDRLTSERIAHPTSPFGHVTVSIGIACATEPTLDSWPALLERADQALYIAKEAGRNCLHVG